MGLGILDTKEKSVPGTALLTDDDPLATLSAYGTDLDITKLKYATGKNSHIVLVPQPSDDPNDPLNWTPFEKWSCFAAVLFSGTLTGVAGPLLSAATLVVAEELNLTLAEAGQATAGWQTFGVGISLPLWSPIMMKCGRRPAFLAGAVLMVIGAVVTACATTQNTLIAGRAILGIGMGPAECLAVALVADLFYVHERGLPVALYNIFLINGINLSPSLSGLVTARHSWQTAAWIFAGFSIASLIFTFFFQRETMYIRTVTHLDRAVVSGSTENEDKAVGNTAVTDQLSTMNIKRKTYIQSLAPYSGIFHTQATFFQMVYRPMLLVFSPVIWFTFLAYGVPITFIVLVAVSASFIFSVPPYNFGPEESGYIWFAPFIGCFLATIIAGKVSDWMSKKMASRNKGIFEPEFRLPLLLLLALPSGFGYLGWGLAVNSRQPWIAPVICFGLIGFGLTFGLTISSAYLVDSFGDASTSALNAMQVLKQFSCFSSTYWAAPWIQQYTILQVFGTISGMHFAAGILAIPMYIYGKKVRLWTSKRVNFRDDAVMAH